MTDPELLERARSAFAVLCESLDRSPPGDLTELYGHTQALTESLNELGEQGFSIETEEREAFAAAVAQVCDAYGFPQADIEEAIANRDW